MPRFKYYINRLYSKISTKTRSLVIPDSIHAYWWSKDINFGDLLTPCLLRYYGYTPYCSLPHDAEIISVGSLLEHLPERYKGTILGSGFMFEESSRSFKNATIKCVRGELTRQRIANTQKMFLGDPGLLVPLLLDKREEKNFTLGIVCHFLDKDNEWIKFITKKYSKDILLIDPQRQPLNVIRDIDQCENIISSSLHGIIVADSLGIPNAWLAPSKEIVGKGFKFYDYFSSIERIQDPFTPNGHETLLDITKLMFKVNESLVKEIEGKLDIAFRGIHK